MAKSETIHREPGAIEYAFGVKQGSYETRITGDDGISRSGTGNTAEQSQQRASEAYEKAKSGK